MNIYSILTLLKDQSRRNKVFESCAGNSVSYEAPTSFRILVAPWLMGMVVFIYAYTGVLTSILSVPKLEPIINSVEELATKSQFKLTIEKNAALTSDFLVSFHSTFTRLTLFFK